MAAAKDLDVLPMAKSVSRPTGGSPGGAAGLAGEGLDGGPGAAEADVGGDARHLLDGGAVGEPGVERRLHALGLAGRGLSQDAGGE